MENISAHESVQKMYKKLNADGITNTFDRFDAQGNRCGFCSNGVSCRLCSMGPCRISKKAEFGSCGINADAMAMRNFLHLNIMGTTAYTYHAKEVAMTLKATGKGQTPFTIRDEAKLRDFANKLGIKGEKGFIGTKEPKINELAVKVGDAMLKSIHADSNEPLDMVELFAPESRIKVWKELGIMPGGPIEESMDMTSCAMTNIDGDYVSLAKKALRMSIATIYGSQVPLELGQDILFGTPAPHEHDVDLGIIDPGYVNVVANGHEPFIGAALIAAAHKPENQQKAKDLGAKGLHIIGSIETGQELMQRFEKDDVFVGLTGNWLSIEAALATEGIDVFAMDMNCSPPALGGYQDKYNVTLVSVSKLVAMPGVDKQIIYKPEKVEAQAQELIDLAFENFNKRKAAGLVTNDLPVQKTFTGFSGEAIVGALGGTLDPLLDVIKSGDIKGIVALVSCTTLKDSGQDINTIAITKELIKRDILVLSAGCGNAALQVAGLTTTDAQELAGEKLKAVCESLGIPPVLSMGTCTDTGRIINIVTAVADALGVDPSQLPVAVTAPEYMEQKATIDGVFAIAYGLYTHVAPLAPVGGAPNLVKLLTQDVEGLIGGKLAVETDMVEAADGIEAHIMKKRKALGI
ncbi:MAG TPA: anaerobic carbon-monoxide dehydrogenase catalytic subunit [Methanosarcinaceae archaeon]|nr:anaerobic carbon-monoxide dehydrogenase catalytic subunit [Methanosarcinaceae archaeon]